MVDPVVNKGKVTVSTGYNNTATSIVLATGQGAELPDPVVDGAYNLPWWDSTNYNDPADDPNFEIVRVTGPAGTGDTKTIVRAQEGTAATNKNNADATYKMHLGVTAKTITDLIADVERCATVIVGKSGHVDYLTTDYGSDDACIQAAIDYVDGLGGGSVLIREGTYTTTDEIKYYSNMIIEGTGFETIIKLADNTNPDGVPLGVIGILTNNDQVSGNNNIIIKNIKIDGNKSNGNGGGNYNNCIKHVSGTNIYFENLFLTSGSGCGIYVEQSTFLSIKNNKITDVGACGIGTSVGANSYCLIDGNHIDDTDDEAIDMNNYGEKGSRVIITNNNCNLSNNSDESGIEISYNTYGMKQVIISNNIVSNFWSGIYLRGNITSVTGDTTQHEFIVSNNISFSNRSYGIYSLESRDIIFSNNITMYNTEGGIRLSGTAASSQLTSNLVCTSNIASKNTKNGIIINRTDGCNISLNQCNLNGRAGIVFLYSKHSGCIGNIVSNNSQSVYNTYSGIQLSRFDNGICNENICFDNATDSNENLTSDAASGQKILVVATTEMFVKGQTITISDTTPQSETGTIDDIISNTQIQLTSNLTNTYTTANTANVTGKQMQKYGIDIESTSNNNIISENQVSDNVGAGINNASTDSRLINNIGYNPVGAVGPPSVPATTVNYTNAYGYPCQVQVYGGTVTEIDIDDIATGLTSGIFIIPPEGTINITYSAAPSWRWWGL